MTVSALGRTEIEYPDSDGLPMAENEYQFDVLTDTVRRLQFYFKNNPNVYVMGNLFIYYEQGNNKANVSPDAFVIFGVNKQKRMSYKVWEEGGQTPDWVMEIASPSTKKKDTVDKKKIYAENLQVKEYVQYDPVGGYLSPRLQGFRLQSGKYVPMPLVPRADGIKVLKSAVLGLELQLLEDGELRLYDQSRDRFLPNYWESEEARVRAELARTQAELARREAQEARTQAELALEQESRARRAAVERLLKLGLTVEQVAEALGYSVAEVRELAVE